MMFSQLKTQLPLFKLLSCILNNDKYNSLIKEKNELDQKNNESKKYILRLEQNLLQKNKITGNIFDPKKSSKVVVISELISNNASPSKVEYGEYEHLGLNHNKKLEEFLSSQAFEIKILTNALVIFFERTNKKIIWQHRSQILNKNETTIADILKESSENKLKLQNIKEDYDRLLQIYQNTLIEVFLTLYLIYSEI